jgi:hypothetical protein
MATNSQVDLSAVESAFKAYLGAFNAGDLAAVRQVLHPDVAVHLVGGKNAPVIGRDVILPSYQKDMALGKQVQVVRGPFVRSGTGLHGAAAVVDVTLRAETPQPLEREAGTHEDALTPHTLLDVLYFYDTSLRQVRHDISNVRNIPS